MDQKKWPLVGQFRWPVTPCPFDIGDDGAERLRIESIFDVIQGYRDRGEEYLRLRSPIRFDYDPAAASLEHPATHVTLNHQDRRNRPAGHSTLGSSSSSFSAGSTQMLGRARLPGRYRSAALASSDWRRARAVTAYELAGRSFSHWLLGRAETQLRGDDDAGADLSLAALGDAVADAPGGSTHEIGDDVGVEQIRGLRHGGHAQRGIARA